MMHSWYREVDRRYRALGYPWRVLGLASGVFVADLIRGIIGIPEGLHDTKNLLVAGGIALLCCSVGVVAVALIAGPSNDQAPARDPRI